MTVVDLERLAELPVLACAHTIGGQRPLRNRADARRAARQVNAERRGRRVYPAQCLCGAWTTTTNAHAARAARGRRRR